jgi:hypothetical protein
MVKYDNIAGKTFGKLTAIKPMVKYSDGKKRTLWVFQCVCGELTERPAHKVVGGWVTSCGCAATSADKKYVGEQSVAYNIYYVSYSDGDLSFDNFLELVKQNCYYCGLEPSNCRANRKNASGKKITFIYNGLDRLDNNFPHNLDNVVPCCANCNQMKSFRNIEVFLKQIEAIYAHRIVKYGENNGIV